MHPYLFSKHRDAEVGIDHLTGHPVDHISQRVDPLSSQTGDECIPADDGIPFPVQVPGINFLFQFPEYFSFVSRQMIDICCDCNHTRFGSTSLNKKSDR